MEFPLRRLFEAATVHDLAQLIETCRWAAQTGKDVPGTTSEEREEIAI